MLGVGAVLLVSAGATVASAHGGIVVRVLLVVLAGTAAWFSVRTAASGLRSSEEMLAACAAGLAVAGASQGGPALDGDPVTALLLAAGFLVLHRMAPTTAAWPLVSWAAAQLAVLRALDLVPGALHTELYLCVALVGLGIALFGRGSWAGWRCCRPRRGGWPGSSAGRRAPGRTTGAASGSPPR